MNSHIHPVHIAESVLISIKDLSFFFKCHASQLHRLTKNSHLNGIKDLISLLTK